MSSDALYALSMPVSRHPSCDGLSILQVLRCHNAVGVTTAGAGFRTEYPGNLIDHHTVMEARARGWDELENGDLLREAEAAGFEGDGDHR